MFSKSRKDKKRQQSPEECMIEMNDLSLKQSSEQANNNTTQVEINVDYPEISESQVRGSNQRQAPQPNPSRLPQYAGQQYPGQQRPAQPVQQQPTRSSAIRMNGMVFQEQAPPQNRRPGVPQMTVHCKWCTLSQVVAGNSHIFICTACDNMNECRPIYNLFVCYGCHTQVCYQLGVSQMIRCTRCRTVNRVPMAVSPNYSSEQQYYLQQQQKRRQEDEQQKRIQKDQQHMSQQMDHPQYERAPPVNISKESLREEEIILFEEPPVDHSDRYQTQKREYAPHQPDLLEFDEQSWQEPRQQQRQLIRPSDPTDNNKL